MNTYDFRLPFITASDTAGQIAQIRSFLHQTIEQLNFALKNVDEQIVEQKNMATRQFVSGETDKAQASKNTFDSVKALIINSAEIVEAYYEEFNRRFSSNYVAQSEFGTYKAQVTNDIKASADGLQLVINNVQSVLSGDINTLDNKVDNNMTQVTGDINTLDGKVDTNMTQVTGDISALSQNVEQNIGNVQEVFDGKISDNLATLNNYQSQITDDINALAAKTSQDLDSAQTILGERISDNLAEIIRTKGVIKLGLLETVGGEGIYGMEVGSYTVDEETGEQTMTARYARFTSDRLAFYGASQTEPVAYISNNKLFITNAEITGTLILGGYRIDTNDGLIFRWVGV